ncbi:Oligopeptide transporter OPT superfamily [Neofusicoccum parvum]|nr:Oligopeptide transporter OPT superfamily [Neofusicoccum parvum]
MKSGIGLLPLTFDWSQIAYISSPLIAPPWAIINLLASLVFWIYIISPALYYTNTWYSAYLPIQSNSVFDNMAETYNVSKVIDKSNGFQFDPAKYYSYSPLYMPVTYALNMFGLSFATIPALLIWIGLEKRKELKAAFKGALNFKRHLRVEQGSDALVPTWWYLISCAISVALGMFACEYYPVQLRWYGALFAFVISSIMFVPVTRHGLRDN